MNYDTTKCNVNFVKTGIKTNLIDVGLFPVLIELTLHFVVSYPIFTHLRNSPAIIE